jgi:hypothetical protein
LLARPCPVAAAAAVDVAAAVLALPAAGGGAREAASAPAQRKGAMIQSPVGCGAE